MTKDKKLCNVHNHARNMYYANSCINLVKTNVDGGGQELCNVQNHARICNMHNHASTWSKQVLMVEDKNCAMCKTMQEYVICTIMHQLGQNTY